MILAVSIGCPAGVGPEVAVQAASELTQASVLLVGDLEIVRRAAKLRGVASERIVPVEDEREIASLEPGSLGVWMPAYVLEHDVRWGRPHSEAGRAQLAWIDEALRLVRQGWCHALVTGPVSKEIIAHSGAPGARLFRGHTEHLATSLGAPEPVMAFHHEGSFTTALVTTHVPLREVPALVTPERVGVAILWLARALSMLLGRVPRIAVAGLNPHAGEGGLLGSEERDNITPGLAAGETRLRRADIEVDLHGPIGAESAFRLARDRRYDGVVAMYHDQATIPCKLLGFGEAVNVTLGLPIVRTSVDHGTAYDLAGIGTASARGMVAALALATQLAGAQGMVK